MRTKAKSEKGITLIALIVTIIVLLILASITIGTLIGEHGIIAETNTAKEETIIREEKEVIQLAYINCQQENKYTYKVGGSKLETEIRN